MRPCPNLNYNALHITYSHSILLYRFYAQNSPRLLLEPSASQDIQHNSFLLETRSKSLRFALARERKSPPPVHLHRRTGARMRISVSKKVVHKKQLATGRAADVAVSSAVPAPQSVPPVVQYLALPQAKRVRFGLYEAKGANAGHILILCPMRRIS